MEQGLYGRIYLWAICQKPLWVKWIHTSVIEGKCIRAIKTPSNASWTDRKLFQLRTITQPWIKNIVGDSQLVITHSYGEIIGTQWDLCI